MATPSTRATAVLKPPDPGPTERRKPMTNPIVLKLQSLGFTPVGPRMWVLHTNDGWTLTWRPTHGSYQTPGGTIGTIVKPTGPAILSALLDTYGEAQ